MARFTDNLVKLLGGATKEDIAVAQKKTAETIEKTIDAKLKSGLDQNGRPQMRASFMKGQAIPPEKKAGEYVKSYTSWTYACVSLIAQEFANIKLRLYKRGKQDEFTVVDQHPSLDLLHDVNPLYTANLLFESTQGYMELTGETFWWLAGSDKQGRNPREIWILRPDWIQINDTKSKLIETYSYGPPGEKKILIPFEQVVHFKDFNPQNPYRGHGAVKAGARAIDTDEFAAEYNRRFFFNDATPNGVMETEQFLQEQDYERIRTEWENVHQGVDNAHKFGILEAGLKWKDVGSKHSDMQFIDGRKLTRDEILAMFKVPKSMLGITEDVNRANGTASRAVFLENVIEPKMRRFVEFLNEFYLAKYGDNTLFFDFESPIPADEAMKLKKVEVGMAQRIMTINEGRELLGLESIEGGDELPEPPADPNAKPDDEKDPEADDPNQTDDGDDQDKSLKLKNRTVVLKKKPQKFNVRIKPLNSDVQKIEQAYQKIEEKTRDLLLLMTSRRDPEKAADDEIKDATDVREIKWKAVTTRTDPRENNFRRLLNDALSTQESEVMDRVGNGVQKMMADVELKTVDFDTVKKSTVDQITNLDSFNQVWAEILMPEIRAILESEGITQIQQLVQGSIFFMATDEVKKYIKNDGVKFIKAVNEETAKMIQDQLIEGIEKGESIAKLKERVASVYEDARGYRSERIARTEVLRASNFATEEAYRQSDVVEAKEWLTAHDERTCPYCGPQDGKILELGKSFFEEGDVVTGVADNGKTVRLTIGLTDIQAPPLHPNCRCTLIPVLKNNKAVVGQLAMAVKTLDQIKDKIKALESEKDKTAEEVEAARKELEAEKEATEKELEKIRESAKHEADEIIETAKQEAQEKSAGIIEEATELREKARQQLYDQ